MSIRVLCIVSSSLLALLAGCSGSSTTPTSPPASTAAPAPTAPLKPTIAAPAAPPSPTIGSAASPQTPASPIAAASPLAPASPTASPQAALPEGEVRLGSFTFNNHGLKDARGTDELELEADDFYFEPTFVRGTPGQKLTLEIENEGAAEHTFTIPGQQIDTVLQPGGKADVAVTVPNSGALRFYCRFHTSLGMNGELLAGDAPPQPVS
ncbi:MAG: cupredoxin domain-containing protein [Chloroflexi bacterium]|nr:cupredoxin domain-containing protein [Chloroflexota bacterium]